MRKKRWIAGVLIATIALAGAGFAGCGDKGGESVPTEYTIQYTDGAGVFELQVTDGAFYSLQTIPVKTGYEFLGLFDAEEGGAVRFCGGAALSPFKDKQNIALFAQFAPKKYTLVLDYGGAQVTGDRAIEVSYREILPDLPRGLEVANKTFVGWFTEPDKGGVQISDTQGVLPLYSKVTERVFNLDDPDGYIPLYAGFEGEKFTVTFNCGAATAAEEIMVEYGTPISEVIPETRVNGKAVYKWSKRQNDAALTEVFTGKVTDNLVLYAAEYAPVIDFEPKGGQPVKCLIAPSGNTIALPIPVRDNYTFVRWETPAGVAANWGVMPEDSVCLSAVWQANLVFDENGGTAVADISQEAGTAVIMPTPQKDGYLFAGWYGQDGEKYTSTAMPAVSMLLKAGWYDVKTVKQEFVLATDDKSFLSTLSYQVDLNTLDPNTDFSKTMPVEVDVYFERASAVGTLYFSLYSQNTASDAYRLYGLQKYSANESTWGREVEHARFELTGGNFMR